jgi:hypothetical protein
MIERADEPYRDRARLQGRDPNFEALCEAEIAAADEREWNEIHDENRTVAEVLEFRPRPER